MDDHSHHHHHAAPAGAAERVRDPVCGMMVDPATSLSAEHGGTTYHFCCEGCRTSFVGNPEKYLNAKPFELPVRGFGTTSSASSPSPLEGEGARRADEGFAPHPW